MVNGGKTTFFDTFGFSPSFEYYPKSWNITAEKRPFITTTISFNTNYPRVWETLRILLMSKSWQGVLSILFILILSNYREDVIRNYIMVSEFVKKNTIIASTLPVPVFVTSYHALDRCLLTAIVYELPCRKKKLTSFNKNIYSIKKTVLELLYYFRELKKKKKSRGNPRPWYAGQLSFLLFATYTGKDDNSSISHEHLILVFQFFKFTSL